MFTLHSRQMYSRQRGQLFCWTSSYLQTNIMVNVTYFLPLQTRSIKQHTTQIASLFLNSSLHSSCITLYIFSGNSRWLVSSTIKPGLEIVSWSSHTTSPASWKNPKNRASKKMVRPEARAFQKRPVMEPGIFKIQNSNLNGTTGRW